MIIEVPYFKYTNKYKIWLFENRDVVRKWNIKLKVYDGIPGSPWNGGRIPEDTPIPENYPVSFALTNHTIDDMNHPESLRVLTEYHKKGNTLIISNLELAAHLRKLFPLYDQIYSITHFDISKGWEAYKEIESKFEYIVPRNEIVDQEALGLVNSKQYIILFSHECSYCPLYNDHYRTIGQIIKDGGDTDLYRCWFKERDLLERAGYDPSIYEGYKYMNSKRFHKKLIKIDPRSIAGYKVGRNHQTWFKVEDELRDIVEVLNEFY